MHIFRRLPRQRRSISRISKIYDEYPVRESKETSAYSSLILDDTHLLDFFGIAFSKYPLIPAIQNGETLYKTKGNRSSGERKHQAWRKENCRE